ncbi:hypothetical protein CK231_04305 [Mesorhizobium loti]|nr:hypothetical protein CK231_04305 [Mesorhizobium loti]QGX75964.1 hypothetical protein EB234_02715 [Mesorhizobium japonicum R7A]PBB51172.1 hypothetical protein CK213_03435 [Mesorhizobium loti]PBB56734.1 hypothetical protein CK223_05155 [Mesorhizobium loti]PBB63001.1 hypothetical protein CK217_08645 [Mesorhizobium loti]
MTNNKANDRRRHSTAPPSVLPDISPTRGEIGSFSGGASLAASEIGEGEDDRMISPLVGEMSGRTGGGAVELRLSNLAVSYGDAGSTGHLTP